MGYLLAEYTPNKNTKAELMELQDSYLETRANSTLAEMWTRLYAMAQGHVRQWMRKARRTLSAPDVENKAADAANYIIEQYLTRPDFRITDSFDSYLRLRVMAELASPKRRLRDASEIHLEAKELDELPGCDPDPFEQTVAYQDAVLEEIRAVIDELLEDSPDACEYRRLVDLWIGGWSRQELRTEAARLELDYAEHIEHRKAIREYVATAHNCQYDHQSSATAS